MKCGESDNRNDNYEKNYTDEKFFRLLIPEASPLILDIGAHFGESVEFFRNIFPAAEIYSVEPDPTSYEKLLGKFPDNPLKAVNAAIGAKTGSCVFYQYDKSHLNSLYAINKSSEDSLGYAEFCEENKTEVPCFILDDLITKLGLENRRIDLLKIDAQGGEADILNGGCSTLEKVENITLELNFFDFYSKKNSFYEIEQFLPDFELYSITKVSQNPKNFRTDWVEVFYRRKSK
ncbi:FkbM family methyltransferase [bacterium]|nr:FkbM family methyltransferase [bacterium]